MDEVLFKQLFETPSVSGTESVFQMIVAKELSDYSHIKFADILNNFTVQVCQGPQKVLITAHADEIGFIVTYINDEGFIYFQPVGGVDPDIAVGQQVNILTNRGIIPGIIGREEIWDTASSKEQESIVPYKELWIDIGANKKASELVSIGDVIIFDTLYKKLQDPFMLARGADDKLGVYALIQTVRMLAKEPNPNISLFAVTTTQEEVGSRGAQPAVNRIQPKYSIIIDTIRATDTPVADKEEIGMLVLGNGPVITRGSNTNPDLFFILSEIAKRENIPFQVEADAGPTATDADPIQISGIGTATIVVGIPVRYTHFPSEVFNWEDVEHTVKLLTVFLKNLRESA